MIIPDANLLIYAHDETSPWHGQARAWWEATLSGTEPVGRVTVEADDEALVQKTLETLADAVRSAATH